jgi:hypothetical protein
LRAVLAEATQQSRTISGLVEQVGSSNVIAHVECMHFKSIILEGRTLFVLARPDVRYVRVEVDCLLPRQEVIAIIGHELQHVAEVAAAPDVVDEQSFARLLGKIGFPTQVCSREQYETEAAILVAERVRREISTNRRLPTSVGSLTRAADSSSR